ncbi:MAG: ABC-type transporter, integral rane subunit [Pseudonocardiales bacterium]|nr:ABC-type transporter, integral rane subunit [Pseudonocardiales bacterium]
MSSDVTVMSGDTTPPLGDEESREVSPRDRQEATPTQRWRSIASTATNRFGLVGVLIAVIIVYTILMPGTFATVANLRVITATQSVVIIMSLGLTFPLAVGEFDFSFGPMVAFASSFLAVLTVEHHVPLPIAILAVIGACLGFACITSFFVVVVGINSLITTLGLGTFITGITLWVANSQVLAGPPHALTAVSTHLLFSLPYPVYISLGLAAVVWFIYQHTALGRYIYLTGEGRSVARLSGIPVNRIRTGAYLIEALLCAFAGVINFGRLGSADPNLGTSFLLPATAAVFLGATTIVPGRFNAWGTVLAVYTLITGVTGLELLGGAGYVEDLFNGAALVLAVAAAHLLRRRRT